MEPLLHSEAAPTLCILPGLAYVRLLIIGGLCDTFCFEEHENIAEPPGILVPAQIEVSLEPTEQEWRPTRKHLAGYM